MRINFFKEKNKIRLNKNLDFDSDIAISNANNESNNYLTANSDYYNNEMRGLRRDIIVIEELIRVKLPDVHLRLKEFDVDLSWICSEWLLCLFCTTFKSSTLSLFHTFVNNKIQE
ncbi:hypothetical protein PFMALIP_03215 [Plasmodium falciparum MaliPS096_E11]|uniref:Rab-GAP TBC domain-containing protein n=1 Tax=Plasmodium falciparum MaliPS096_E11 TaxID=1036727 RepID=A0A024WQ68_PLAFA|nr:hypothetical protein PFMALIP_03215 [Plasmodium falciparum MaliPS096_E11]